MSEKLKNLFFEFLVEVRTKYFKVPCDSAIFEAKAKAFLKEIVALQNTNPLHVTYLKEEFYDELLKVKHMLSDIKDNPIYRSFHDKIFKTALKISKSAVLGITLVFGEFIKGITYFKTGGVLFSINLCIIGYTLVVMVAMLFVKHFNNVLANQMIKKQNVELILAIQRD